MNETDHIEAATKAIVARTAQRFARYRQRTIEDADGIFARLLAVEWVLAIVVALVVSPVAWEGRREVVHLHVWIALGLGAAIVSLPVFLALRRPGRPVTRHLVAVAQMMMVALFIHLSGGRIETHFLVFCSLAVLAFYLDPWVLLTGAGVVALDHFVRGLAWPESVYGTVSVEWWRFGEHAAWVVICVAALAFSIRRHLRDWVRAAEEGGLMEAMAEGEWTRSSVLQREAAAKETAGDLPKAS
jgi:hypothetical protein